MSIEHNCKQTELNFLKKRSIRTKKMRLSFELELKVKTQSYEKILIFIAFVLPVGILILNSSLNCEVTIPVPQIAKLNSWARIAAFQ